MSFTFTLPSASLYQAAQVEMVILPGVDGFFGVMPNYVPTIAELSSLPCMSIALQHVCFLSFRESTRRGAC